MVAVLTCKSHDSANHVRATIQQIWKSKLASAIALLDGSQPTPTPCPSAPTPFPTKEPTKQSDRNSITKNFASPLKWLLNGSSRATPGPGVPLDEPDRDHDERTRGPRFSRVP
jgi:hypothetical protein